MFLSLPASTLWPIETQYRRIRTAHFDILFTEEWTETAGIIAGFAEEAYEEVSRRLGHRPDRIPLVLPGATDLANGAFIPAPDRIVIYPAPTSGFRLRTLFIHELTHYIHLTSPSGIFGFLGRIFGDGVRAVNTALIPGWMAEGITIHLETALTAEGRGRDPFFQAAMKGFIYDQALWEWWQSAYAIETYPINRIYLAGYFTVRQLLLNNGGETAFMDLWAAFTGPSLFSQNRAVKRITGQSMELLTGELEEDLRDLWKDDFLTSPGTALKGPVPWNGTSTLLAAVPEGLFFYHENPYAPPAIYALPLPGRPESAAVPETLRPVLKVRLSTPTAAAVSADGKSIYFTANRYENGGARSELFHFDIYTDTLRRISSGGGYIQPALSPDGKELLALRRHGIGNELVRVNPSDGTAESLLIFPGEGRMADLRFSPVGGITAFSGGRSAGEQDIFINRPGEETFRLGNPESGEYRPFWSSDGSLLFVSDISGALALYRIEAEKFLPLRDKAELTARLILEDPVAIDGAMQIPGNERLLAYTTFRSRGKQILLKEEDTGRAHEIMLTVELLGDEISADPSAGNPDQEVFRSKPFFPLSAVHTLIPFFALNAEGSQIRTSLGATLLGADPTEKTALNFFAGYLPETSQLEASGTASIRNERAVLRYGLEREYQAAEETAPAERIWTHTLTAGYTPWESYNPFRWSSLTLLISAQHYSSLSDEEDFSLLEESGSLPSVSSKELHVSASAAFSSRRRPAPPFAFYGGNDFYISSAFLTAPEILDRRNPESILLVSMEKGILPSPQRSWRLRFGGKLLLSDSGSTGDLLPYRGDEGWNDPLAYEHGGRALVSADLQIPAALFEKRILGIPFTRLGFSVFAETGATFPGPGESTSHFFESASPDSAMLAGAEVSSRMMISRIPVPFAFQVRLRIDYNEPFDPLKDLAVSLTLGDYGEGTY